MGGPEDDSAGRLKYNGVGRLKAVAQANP